MKARQSLDKNGAQAALQSILHELAGDDPRLVARIEADAKRLLYAAALGQTNHSRNVRRADTATAAKQIRAVQRCAKALAAAIGGLSPNVRIAFRADLDEITDSAERLVRDAGNAEMNVNPKGKKGVRNHLAKQVDEAAAKIYSSYLGPKPKPQPYWNAYKNDEQGGWAGEYLPFLKSIFDVLDISDSPLGTAQSRRRRKTTQRRTSAA